MNRKPRRPPKADVLTELLALTDRLGEVSLDAVDAEIKQAAARVDLLQRVRSIVEIAQGKVEAVPEAEYRVRVGAGAADQKCVPALGPSPPTDRAKRGREWVNPNRLKVARYLEEHGPQRFSDIARGTGLKTGSLGFFVRHHDWFSQSADGLYYLSAVGKQAIADPQLVLGDNRGRLKRERNERNAVLQLRAIGTKLEAKL
jgi:hypothetical protein